MDELVDGGENMREAGMRMNGNSSPAFLQNLLAMYICTYRNYLIKFV